MSKLDTLLGRLDAAELARLEFEVDSAYKTFPLTKSTVETYPAFEKLVGRYYRHLLQCVHHCGGLEDHAKFLRDLALHVAENAFKGGRVEAFRGANQGIDGGVHEVLQRIGDDYKTRILDAHVDESLRQTIDMEDWAARERLAAAYLKRFGHLVQAHTSALMLAGDIKGLFVTHMQIQGPLRRSLAQK